MAIDIPVKETMTMNPITIEPEVSTLEAVKKMLEKDVGSLVVCKASKLKGIITESDIMKHVAAKDRKASSLAVKDIMTTDLITVDPDISLSKATKRMIDEDVRRLPVTEDGELVGLLTEKDVLKIAPSMSDLIVERMRVRESARKPIFEERSSEGVCENCGKYSEDLVRVGGEFLCPECRRRRA